MRHAERRIVVSVRVTMDVADALDALVAERRFRSSAAAGAAMIEYGLQVVRYEDLMKDKRKAGELQQRLQEAVERGALTDYMETLTEDKIQAVIMAGNLEKERRHVQTALPAGTVPVRDINGRVIGRITP